MTDLIEGYKTESPIETAMVAAILGWFAIEGDRGLSIKTQVTLGNYRLDIAFYWESDLLLAVECDGHDFHERTKEQAKRDRARDRWMLERETPTARFTGSEIYDNPAACALEAINLASQTQARIAHNEWMLRGTA